MEIYVLVAQFVFLFQAHANFPKNFNRNGHQKLSNVMVKTNWQQFSMVYTLIDQKNDVKMFKTLQWNHLPTTRGSTCVLNSVNVISKVDKSTDHGKLLSIC